MEIIAPATILATGGVGGLYAVTTTPPELTGEGLGLAALAGAVISDPEFVQFHPTAIDIGRDPAPLATEALRGEGAVLIDATGARFMTRYHPDAELAPRDVVARAIHAEREAGRGAFLDARAAVGARFPKEFPAVFAACMAGGIDPRTQPIPVAPACHYHMGGIATDAEGRTSLAGLYAAGECASTGVHGANRLASNSLVEAGGVPGSARQPGAAAAGAQARMASAARPACRARSARRRAAGPASGHEPRRGRGAASAEGLLRLLDEIEGLGGRLTGARPPSSPARLVAAAALQPAPKAVAATSAPTPPRT